MHSFVMGSYRLITNCGRSFRTFILYSHFSSDVRNQTERKEEEEAKEEGCSAAVEAEISVQVEDQKEI